MQKSNYKKLRNMKNIVLLIIFSFPIFCFSQSDSDRAKAYYFEAVNSFESKNYDKTLEYCQQVEDILKTSNARVEALRVKSYFAKGNMEKAKEALNRFSNYGADESLSAEISPYLVKIEESEKEKVRQKELADKKAKEEEQKIIDKANHKKDFIQKAVAEGNFDMNGLKKVEYKYEYETREGFIDANGNEVVPIEFGFVYYLDDYGYKKYIVVKKNGENLYGMYNTTGEMVIPLEYTYHSDAIGFGPFDKDGFKLGLIAAQKNRKWGYVNESGKVVIPFKFDSVSSFKEVMKTYDGKKHLRNAAYVWIDRDNFYINTSGERIYK